MICRRILMAAAAALLLGASAATAQTVELGVKVGRGPFHYDESMLPGSRAVVGVEACVGCERRGVFVEYLRWGVPGVNEDACRRYYPGSECTTGYRQADTLAAGIRFQGRERRRVQLFADVGGALGHSRYGASRLTTSNHVGAAGALGATVRFDQFYVRAAGSLLLLSGYYVGVNATIGAGWRF